MDKTRIAVAGAGAIGLAHIAAAQASPSCTLSAIVDPAPAARSVAAGAGVPLYGSLAELFAADRPDGVILATPNKLHVPQAIECLREKGVAVLLEKPIATSVVEAEQLVEFAEANAAPLLIGHHRAHSTIIAKAREVINQGTLGRLVAVTGSALFFKPDQYFAEAPWRREAGAGPILLNLIHEIHNLRMLCGEIVAVQAFASNATRGFAVEDTVAIVLRFASGVLGTFLLSDTAASARSWEQTSRENTAYASYADEDCYVIAGTHASLGGADDAAEGVSGRGGALVVEAVRVQRRRDDARRPAGTPARAFRRSRARRGGAAGQRARRPGEPARHRRDRRGGEVRNDRRTRLERIRLIPHKDTR